jgi:hypothetical protein
MNGAHEEHSENTASSIPLYSTQPSVSASAFHENPRMLGEQSRQTYIQVPHEPRAQRPILQKTGSSVATIVLGSLLLVLGVIALVLGMQFPLTLFSSFGADPRMMIALGCAAIGGVLLVVAAGWSLASFIRNRTMSADTNDDGDFDAKDADGRVGDDGNDAYDDGRVSRG